MIGWRSRRIGAWATAVRIGPLGACSRELDCGGRLTTPHRYAERPRRPKNLCLDKGRLQATRAGSARPRSQTAYPTPRGTHIDRTDSRQEATTLGRRTDEQLAQQLPSTTNSDSERIADHYLGFVHLACARHVSGGR